MVMVMVMGMVVYIRDLESRAPELESSRSRPIHRFSTPMGQTETERTTLGDEKADTASGIRFSESYAAGHNAFWR